ncbi:MAG: hypothetical protein BMS9Abin31_1107 [Gammaproteobacteria bacterium]|nr:MAG: hypothetical protein BMS9Abin31_1107 [Gammaproteobacteria bacterium]
MNLIRLIVIALIVYLLVQIFKRWTANKNSQTATRNEKLNNMVRCKVCQLHIPENEALQQDGDFFCSQAHLDAKQD